MWRHHDDSPTAIAIAGRYSILVTRHCGARIRSLPPSSRPQVVMPFAHPATTHVTVQRSAPADAPRCLTQNPVIRVTLTGPTLVLTILAIIVGIQSVQPSLACTLIAFAPIPWIIHNDYENFLSLGPGGTPATFPGYLKVTYLRLFALSDPYRPPPLSEPIYPPTGYSSHARAWLPPRPGPRPTIAGIAPQRQLDQPGCPQMYLALRTALERAADKHPEILRTGTSCFEKKGLALFALAPINATCRGEIVHVHHSDRSMHMNLHPEDAKAVLEMGWGERHPLARGGWMKAYVPREFVMVYAPRDRSELDVICRIIEAAAFWVIGEHLDVQVEMDRALNGEVP